MEFSPAGSEIADGAETKSVGLGTTSTECAGRDCKVQRQTRQIINCEGDEVPTAFVLRRGSARDARANGASTGSTWSGLSLSSLSVVSAPWCMGYCCADDWGYSVIR